MVDQCKNPLSPKKQQKCENIIASNNGVSSNCILWRRGGGANQLHIASIRAAKYELKKPLFKFLNPKSLILVVQLCRYWKTYLLPSSL